MTRSFAVASIAMNVAARRSGMRRAPRSTDELLQDQNHGRTGREVEMNAVGKDLP
jgi:hypothetical protein